MEYFKELSFINVQLLIIIFIKDVILQKLMENRKRVIVLITIALILATTAVMINVVNPEISTEKEPSAGMIQGGVIGINVIPSQVEDKLLEQTGEQA